MKGLKFFGAVLIAFACGRAVATVSEPAVIWTDPVESLQWKTIMETPMKLALVWPESAASATLTILSGTSLVETPIADKSLDQLTVAVTMPEDEPSERVLGLVLAYKDAQGSVLETQTARLGLVRGVCGAATRCLTDMTSHKWKKVKGSAVFPIPEDSTSLAVDDSQVAPLDAPGWYQWSDVEAGAHALTLTTASGDMTVTLQGAGGLVILFR